MISLAPFAARWDEIDRLLDRALDLPVPERAAWLDALGPEADPCRDALRALLSRQSDVETDDFLVAPPALPIPEAAGPAHGPAAGDTIGAYRLIGQIGQGGMGTVWFAERADGLIARRVALKLPRLVWGDSFAERLARERELLATLAHEHIARLDDAGIDAHGRPYLAMEYVEGETLDAWCRSRAPALRERVALLLQVMAAVGHAHSRLVVHRDLKPGNVMVTRDAQVKLLDFGIAKLLDGGATRRTALTELTGRALTPDYASPEQIRGEPLGTASDIYSMAVVAYELLAGSRPYRLKGSGAAELEQAIASVEPPLASDTARGLPVARELRGDLDAILNKALKKAPAERYPTMEAFALDLRRYLDGAAVEARPDGWTYRAAKFIRRHRLQVGAGAAVAVALLGGASVALWQAREARSSAERAQSEAAKARVEAATAKAVQGFIESVFSANSMFQADPGKAGAATARQLLDRGAERLDNALASEPEAQLRLYGLMTEMYADMWQYAPALALSRRAMALATRLHGPRSDAALLAAARSGQMLDELGRRDEAQAMLEGADAEAARRASDHDTTRMTIDSLLSHFYVYTQPAKALAHARRAAAIARERGPALENIDALRNLGDVAANSDQLEEARQAYVDAVSWCDRFDAVGVLNYLLAPLGRVQSRLGLLGEAEATLVRAVELAGRLGDALALHNARFELARFQVGNGLLREALATAGPEAEWAREHRSYADMRALPWMITTVHARARIADGDLARGLAELDEAAAMMPPDTPAGLRGQVAIERARALLALGRPAEAGADIERAAGLTSTGREAVVEAWRTVRRRQLVALGRADDALRDFAAHPPRIEAAAKPVVLLPRQVEEATLLLAAGRVEEAVDKAAGTLASIDRLPERRFTRDAEARVATVLGEALLRADRRAEALPVLRRALAASLAVFDPARSPEVGRVRLALAAAERRARP